MTPAPKCEFWVKGDRGRERCGCRAAYWRNSAGGLFYYCETHARDLIENRKTQHLLHKLTE